MQKKKKTIRILSRFTITIGLHYILLLLGTKYRYKFRYIKLHLNLCCRINSRNCKNRERIETSFFTTSPQDKSHWRILLQKEIFLIAIYVAPSLPSWREFRARGIFSTQNTSIYSNSWCCGGKGYFSRNEISFFWLKWNNNKSISNSDLKPIDNF